MLTSSDQAEVAVPPDRWAGAGQQQETLSLFARPHGWSSNGRSVRDGEFRTARSEKPTLDNDEEAGTASTTTTTTTTSIEELVFSSHSETNAAPVSGEAAYAYGDSHEDLCRDAKNVTNCCGRCPPEGVGRRDDVTDPPELSSEAAKGLSNGSSWGRGSFAAAMSSRDGSNGGLAFRDGGTGLTGHDVQAACSPPLGGGELWDSGVTVDAGGSQVSESESQSGESDVTTADAYRAAFSSLDALVTSSGTESMLDQCCTSARDADDDDDVDDDDDNDDGGGGGGGGDDGLNVADSYTIGKQINGGDGLGIAGSSYTVAKQPNGNVHTMNSPVNDDDDDDDDSGPLPARVEAPLLLPPLVPLPATRDDGDVSSNPSLSADAAERGASVKAATLTPADGAASTTRKSQLLSPPSRKKGGAASKENVCGRSRDQNRVDKHGGNLSDVTSGDRAAAARTTRSKGVTAAAGATSSRGRNGVPKIQESDVSGLTSHRASASASKLRVDSMSRKPLDQKVRDRCSVLCPRLFRCWMLWCDFVVVLFFCCCFVLLVERLILLPSLISFLNPVPYPLQ